MSDEECRNDCVSTLSFPKKPENRPGLSRIGYRIGRYADFREALLRRLNQDHIFANWTHREPDDPGIALLEGASILCDILTFYQDLYANEAYLRTAEWRESISDLVRLLGYLLSPGTGGRAIFAFEIKGEKPVRIPAGFPLKAKLEEIEKQVDFETKQGIVAYPHLSKFHLYRPRLDSEIIRKGTNRLEVKSVFVKDRQGEEKEIKDIASFQALNLKPGDRIMLVPDTSILDEAFLPEPASIKDQCPETIIISNVEQILDRIVIEFEGLLTTDRDETVTAYRIGRSFRHFGYNAPFFTTRLDDSSIPPILKQDETKFKRLVNFGRLIVIDSQDYSALKENKIPLDAEVNDLAIGNKLIFHGLFYLPAEPARYNWGVVTLPSIDSKPFYLFVIKEIKNSYADTLTWGNLNGPSTVITIEPKLIASHYDRVTIDIRKFQIHEVKSPKMTLRAPTQWDDGAITADTESDTEFSYWGNYQEALSLAGRRLILQKDTGTVQEVTVSSTVDDLSKALEGRDEVNPWLWPVKITAPEGSISGSFKLEDFDEEDPKVVVYGNLVEATQGKAERETVLGNGNNSEIFQTFKLPKSPLTYFRSEEEVPPEVPQLQVYVNDRLWTRVPSLFGREPKEEIYIVREDVDGNSWVQFGDGKTGTRLPTGFQNIVARYRTGIGAFGPLEEGATVQAGSRLNHLKKIHLPGLVTGGDLPEGGEKAKEAAPGRIQSLGRLVSLQDIEAEALAIAGVSKAKARWELHGNVPAVVITVLMDKGRDKEVNEVRCILGEANCSRGAGRFPIFVKRGIRRYVEMKLMVGRDPAFRRDLLEKSIKEALGAIDEDGSSGSCGLFSAQRRHFGQPEYATRIEGIVQNIQGVVWARVDELGLTSRGGYRSSCRDTFTLFGHRIKKIECESDALLSLNAMDCSVHFRSASPKEVPLDG